VVDLREAKTEHSDSLCRQKKAVEIFGCSPGSSLCTRCMYNLVNFFCIAPCREEADVSCDAYEQFYRKLFQKKVLSHEVDIKK